MRTRTFTAASMSDAIRLVREQLGPDAIVISTEPGENGGMTITAMADETASADGADAEAAGDASRNAEADNAEAEGAERLHSALIKHGTPDKLAEDLLRGAIEIGAENPAGALAGALHGRFGFAPIGEGDWPKPLFLIGPPGAGKTISTAKLATRLVLGKNPVRVISSDTVRAGGIEQLEAYTRLLGLTLHRAGSARDLSLAVAARIDGERVLIDSAGINPYSSADRGELADYIKATGAEPVLVLPAGGDLFDSTELCRVARQFGCRRMLVTRVDMVRRLGSVLGAAAESELAFSEVGTGPDIAHGLTALDPTTLARLIMPDSPMPYRLTRPRHETA